MTAIEFNPFNRAIGDDADGAHGTYRHIGTIEIANTKPRAILIPRHRVSVVTMRARQELPQHQSVSDSAAVGPSVAANGIERRNGLSVRPA